MLASMSRKGNCWDNAVSETLFGSLKVERLHGERLETIRQAKDAALAWLLWYNRQRMHSTLNYLSPKEYERRSENAGSQAAADGAATKQAVEIWKSIKPISTFPPPRRLREMN